MARGGGTVSPRFLEADKVQVGSVPRVDEGKDTSSRAKTSNVVGGNTETWGTGTSGAYAKAMVEPRGRGGGTRRGGGRRG